MKQKDAIPAGSEWVDKNIRSFSGNPFSCIWEDWMLITSGVSENWNTMTASWGGFGVLWSRDVAFIFIRPTRHTYEFANTNDLFTLSFFEESYRDALKICGEKSGRDIDKASLTGLTPIVFKEGCVGFQEAREIIICKKLYAHNFDPLQFLDTSIEELYPIKDYHRMFIGEILTLKVR